MTRFLRSPIFPGILIVGATVLIYRCITLISQGAMTVFVSWVAALLIAELAVDVVTMVSSVIWLKKDSRKNKMRALMLALVVTLVHAIRVLVFVLGRTGPWINFDVKPEYWADHQETWTWGGVYFAAVMSGLSLVAAFYIWIFLAKTKWYSQG